MHIIKPCAIYLTQFHGSKFFPDLTTIYLVVILSIYQAQSLNNDLTHL